VPLLEKYSCRLKFEHEQVSNSGAWEKERKREKGRGRGAAEGRSLGFLDEGRGESVSVSPVIARH